MAEEKVGRRQFFGTVLRGAALGAVAAGAGFLVARRAKLRELACGRTAGCAACPAARACPLYADPERSGTR
jgi:hypothetical protein